MIRSQPPASTRWGPVPFEGLQRVFHGLRVALAAVGVSWVAWGSWAQPSRLSVTIGILVLMGAHGVFRLRFPDETPLFAPLIDGPAWTLVLLLGEAPAALVGGAFAFLVAVPVLFLPWRQALSVLAVILGSWGSVLALAPPVGSAVWTALVAAAFLGVLLAVLRRELGRRERRYEEALETERRTVRMRGEFVSTVSHEFRTPLTSILGFVETLGEWRDLDPGEVDEFLGILAKETGHLSRLVEDLLLIPRLEAGRVRVARERVALRPLAERVVGAVFVTDDRDVRVTLPGEMAVEADPLRVEQILRNLLENARRYGGDHVLVEGSPQGGDYLVVVADDGPGIPTADLERIFEAFQGREEARQPGQPGVGLGLPIARRLARTMGGDLWCEPGFPRGVRFFLRLPSGGDDGRGHGQGQERAACA